MDNEWMLTATCITKYDPAYMTDRGYTKDEWTGYGEIGKIFDGELLTYDEYECTENIYISAVLLAIGMIGCSGIRIKHAEKHLKRSDFRKRDMYLYKVYEKLENGVIVPINELDDVIRLILRAYFWAELACINVDACIRLNGEFYMFFNYKENGLDEEVIKKIENLGLYVT